MELKQAILAVLGNRQKERLRHLFLSRQVSQGEPIREKEIELIRQLVTVGDHVADIGANVGLYTRELSNLVLPQGRIYAFEPVANNYRILMTVIDKAKLNNVTAFHVALDSRAGSRTLVIPSSASFVGYYLAHFDEDSDEAGRRETVTTATLDGLYAQKAISTIDFVKCDVEGAEVDVLRGGLNLIQSSKPGFMVEVSKGTSVECFAFFHRLQYRAYVYDGETRLINSYRDGEFSNYFFIHPMSRCMARLPKLPGHAARRL